MNLGLLVTGIVLALFGALVWLDRRRTALYFERRQFLGITSLTRARRLVLFSAYFFVLLGAFMAIAGWSMP